MATVYSDYFVAYPQNSDLYEDRSPKPTQAGEVIGFRCAITALPVTADVWRFAKLPDGARVLSLSMDNAGSLGTAVPGTLGLESTDPDCFMTDIDLEDAGTYEGAVSDLVDDPACDGEDYISATIGTVDTGASGTVTLWGTYVVP